jgi:hypothetical protein
VRLEVTLLSLTRLAAPPAYAHGGEDHGGPEAPGTTAASDVHGIAKDLQFLLAIRTARAETAALTERIRVQGTVIAPPDALAEVRPLRAGRLEAAPLQAAGAGFPTLGQAVLAPRSGRPSRPIGRAPGAGPSRRRRGSRRCAPSSGASCSSGD